MSTPGGPYWQEPQPQYQVDPMTGQPTPYQQPGQGDQTQQYHQSYQGFGMYQQPQPGPPKKNHTPWIVVAVVVLVVAIGGVTTLLLVNGGEETAAPPPSSSQAQPPPATSSTKKSTAPKSSSTTPSGATPTEKEQILVESVVTGWQGVLSYKEGVAYDVPKDWEVETPGTVVGFSDNAGKPTAIMHGVTTYKPDACTAVKGSYRGHAGFVTAGTVEPERAATNGVKLFVDAAALNPDDSKAPVEYGPTTQTKVAAGKIDAYTSTAVLTVNQPGDCPSPTVKFTSVAFTNGDKTALFLMYQDQGTPDALPDDIANKLIQSIRPYEG